ncbi:EAL domain-containing protein [Shewanella pealeana]|uniref:Response regulator receiver modulated diguanylate phosphodiesterase n=1 Tax=Shewanella pealeana (strain ATCC 700345 / ANG-SQ1) TaxID=398579 RepID=A8H0Z8_SHEPA|nr:EAL domain-containing response regulator [Shewanella pealeana]ABV86235.1 response regulator receiver modulated diguanylate phosphodiesterase [Shewanella pealeana ATCC 700345]
MKILLIEDHLFQREAMQMQLELITSPKISLIRTAASGVEALQIMADFKPDILLCDLKMPEMDGITFLSHISELMFTGSIIITSASNQIVLDTVQKMCMSYHLKVIGAISKPVKINTLKELLHLAYVESLMNSTFVPPSSVKSKTFTEKELEHALVQGWIKPYFQPLVAFDGGEWKSCEALIRFVHPILGVLPPTSFLPQLSKMHKDAELALLSINYILQHQAELAGRPVAVNINPTTLMHNHFVDRLLDIAKQQPSLCKQVYFEITESDALINTGRALESASRLALHGFNLSIDDFGTGYSSLTLLDTLPFDSLKVDMSFIRAMESSKTAAAIVEACLLLSSRLELKSVAEGVETQVLWQQLQSLGCTLAQGYYIAAPMPVERLKDWHESWQVKVSKHQLATEIC